ncbi:hypothetical protein I3843_07G180900 [Carya illinoinensis]|uniref:C3H1-type domain-containing protein n=1 Tax=Carya illinoinensis TaxID=32201 RepID=A0A8T1Q3M0_CARIL|nr:zinc finger CCCH domain-containing protein 54 [Carya illinoinensis]KAG2699191.1 hypothetical protein I3760_07G181800 [Carya illinoinensis]KAG6649024.1 hypothetical protein CIPAW_07G184400 [Carya illinoinensis]KAG6705584.1 hypothetical protein I3842_07G186700 [Carya illinoinensis]KAG7972382.1 hypothetical protein I3843_07G180900 [Carya illinoinensis]
MLNGINPGFHDFSQQQFPQVVTPSEFNSDHIDNAGFGTDEFRMYAFKIQRCPRIRSHDWTECPYAHRGEKAQRRDPRKFNYSAIACPAFRMNGKCFKSDACEFAHGVFEYWLHPARYRTRACNAGKYCQRKVCFFAHTPEQLRSETKYKCHYTYRARNNGGDRSNGNEGAISAVPPVPDQLTGKKNESNCFDGVSEFLKTLRGLKIRDCEEAGDQRSSTSNCWELPDSDLPHLGWISELLQ